MLLVSGLTTNLNANPTKNPMMSLPLATFDFVRSPQPAVVARGFATAAVLMVLVLVLFTLARILGGHPPGHLSKRQAKRAEARSLRDLNRIEASHSGRREVGPGDSTVEVPVVPSSIQSTGAVG